MSFVQFLRRDEYTSFYTTLHVTVVDCPTNIPLNPGLSHAHPPFAQNENRSHVEPFQTYTQLLELHASVVVDPVVVEPVVVLAVVVDSVVVLLVVVEPVVVLAVVVLLVVVDAVVVDVVLAVVVEPVVVLAVVVDVVVDVVVVVDSHRVVYTVSVDGHATPQAVAYAAFRDSTIFDSHGLSTTAEYIGFGNGASGYVLIAECQTTNR